MCKNETIKGLICSAAVAAIFAIFAGTVLSGCGDSESFTIEGTVDGGASINLRFIYNVNGRLVRGVTAARDGKFEYKGSAAVPTMVEIADNDYRVMARVWVVNGERLECRLVRGNPNALSVKGNDVSERWAKFLNEHREALGAAAESAAADAAVAGYVEGHRDDIVSTLLMLTAYPSGSDPMRADSLMAMIDPAVRPNFLTEPYNALLQRIVAESTQEPLRGFTALGLGDSAMHVEPGAKELTVMALSVGRDGGRDSVSRVLKHLWRKELRQRVAIADLGLDRDTAAWRRSVAPDSAQWPQGWLAGGVASPAIAGLGVKGLPLFVVADSAGVQLLRTESAAELECFVDSCMKE